MGKIFVLRRIHKLNQIHVQVMSVETGRYNFLL